MRCRLAVSTISFVIMRSRYIFILILLAANEHATSNERQRRYLLFTTDTQWGVFATVSVPLQPGSTLSVAWFFEANYYNVDNATYFDPLLGDITIARNRAHRSMDEPLGDFTRSKLYALIESMLQKHGYPGRPCLLRAVCENASTHFLHNGLLGDLLHLILTPSLSMAEEEVDDCYYEAEYYGIENDCDEYEEGCSSSPLEIISMCINDFL